MKTIIRTLALGMGFAAGLVAPSALAQTSNNISAAVLPTSRASQQGTPITIFASIINAGPSTAQNCMIGLENDTDNGGRNPFGLSLNYQAFEADNATPAAGQNIPVNIAVDASQAFVLEISSTSVFNDTPIYFTFTCDGGATQAPVYEGVNTLLLTQASSPVPDIITIGVSPTNDGIIHIPSLGSGEIMAVAALNIGAGYSQPATVGAKPAGANDADVFVFPEDGVLNLPLTAFICETDASAVCTSNGGTYAQSVETTIGSAPATFNIFTNSNRGAGVPLYADIARQNIAFYKDLGATHGEKFGATGLAVTSPGPVVGDTDFVPGGFWNIQVTNPDGTVSNGGAAISVEGEWLARIRNTDPAYAGSNVFQFGFITNTDNTASPDPTGDINFDEYTYDVSGGQVIQQKTGSGTWHPNTFINMTYADTVSKDQPDLARPALLAGESQVRAVYDPIYDRAVTLSGFAGNYDAWEEDNGTYSDNGDFTMNTDGSFSGSLTPSEGGPDCAITGDLTEYGNGKNLFGLNFTVTTCIYAGTYQGLAYQGDDDDLHATNVLYFYFKSLGMTPVASYLTLAPKGSVIVR